MMKCIVATIKSWNVANFYQLQYKYKEHDFSLVQNKEGLSYLLNDEHKSECRDAGDKYRPDYIFFPHWSWIIPKEIYESFNCIVFHMTDLPFGRGGSPLQNLLVRGIYETKISAIKVCAGVDTGPVYFKEPVDISEGNADEIFSKVSNIVFQRMIPRFLTENDLTPVEQSGEVVTFKRRTPEQSEIPEGLSPRQIYDYIRMLDGEGYPTAFKRFDGGKIYFTDAHYSNNTVTARAQFVRTQFAEE